MSNILTGHLCRQTVQSTVGKATLLAGHTALTLNHPNCRRLVVCSGKGFGEQPKPKRPPTAKEKSGNDIVKGMQPVEVSQQARQSDSVPAKPPYEDDSNIEEVPAQVNDRMLGRILLFSGVPVLLGFLLYPLFYYIKIGLQVDLPIWVVYITQLFTFGGGLLGITYGVLSSSWDPTRENSSLLGITEFKANLPVILERVRGRRD